MPSKKNIDVVVAERHHLQVIREIAEKTWPVTFGRILSAQQIEYMLEMMYSTKSLISQIDEKKHVFLLAKEGEDYLGYASYELNHKQQRKTKLHKIYILPEAQGKGIGKRLIEKVISKMEEVDNTALLLNVNRENPAIKFYKSMGFEIVGEENIPIGNGFLMEDYQMEKKLN